MVNPASLPDMIAAAQRQVLRADNVLDGKSDELYMWLWPHQLKAALSAGFVVRDGDHLVLNIEHEPRAIICAMTKIPVM
jgi:hypothetical protein